MHTRMPAVVSAFVLALTGCASTVTASRPDSYYEANVSSPSSPGQSLFTSDATVLSDQDIRRILEFRFVPAPTNRIAVLALGQEYWFGWSDELARLGREIQTNLIGRLRASALVYDASYLPSFLVPDKRTVGAFREAAARYQADLLLIYRNSCRTYEKYRFLSADETKAYCNVEAALLDVRTGIVPFTVVATRDYTAVKRREDTNFRETIRKAELAALGEAMREVGSHVAEFLERSKKA